MRSMRLEGEGRARLEAGAESWVFGFEAAYRADDSWVMALRIPLQGEQVFAFSGLDRAEPAVVPGPEDFRWRIVHALKEASDRRRLGYPQAGHDFLRRWHHLLRLARPGHAPRLACVADAAVPGRWTCEVDGVGSRWAWDAARGELTVLLSLRRGWEMAAVYKNLTGPVFTRLTLEVRRTGGQRTPPELRQELFFNVP